MPDFTGVSASFRISNTWPLPYAQGTANIISASANVVLANVTLLSEALEALKSSFKRLKIKLYLDDGRGTLVLVPNSEIVSDIAMAENLDGWADSMTVALVGYKYQPLVTSLLRGKRHIQLWIAYGSPGFEYAPPTPLFDGYAVGASAQHYPPVTRVTVKDASVLYSEDAVELSLEQNSKRTRMSVLVDLAGQKNPTPLGTIDLGGVGGAGGVITKTASTPIDARKFSVIRDMMYPTGAIPMFAEGQLHMVRFRPTDPVQHVMTKADIAVPIVQDVPDGSVANTVTAVAVRVDIPDDVKTTYEVLSEETFAFYSRKTWVSQIFPGTGEVSSVGAPGADAAVERVVSKVTTSRTSRGSVVIGEQVDESEYYSPQASTKVLRVSSPDPVVLSRADRNVFLYADGTWHIDPMENFRLVRRTAMSKDTDAAGYVTRKFTARYFYHFVYKAVFEVVAGTESTIEVMPSGADIALLETGDGVEYGQESIGAVTVAGLMESGIPPSTLIQHPDSSEEITWDIEEDGTIRSVREVQLAWGSGFDKYPTTIGAFRYGIQSKKYRSEPIERFDLDRVVKVTTYETVDEDHFSISEVTTSSTATPVRKNSVAAGSRPRAERVQPVGSSREMRVTVRDNTRVALVGEVRQEIHNENCQDDDEVRRVAMLELREASAIRITVPIPIEAQVRKNKWIALDVPEIGLTPDKKLRVWAVNWNFGSFRKTLVCKYYPPEVMSE